MTTEQVQKAIEERMREIDLLSDLMKAGAIGAVAFISGKDIFLYDNVPFIETRRMFRRIFGTNEKLRNYYMNSRKVLAVTYIYGKMDVVFFFSNAEEMLKKVSKRRCTIVEEEVTETRAVAVCEVV